MAVLLAGPAEVVQIGVHKTRSLPVSRLPIALRQAFMAVLFQFGWCRSLTSKFRKKGFGEFPVTAIAEKQQGFRDSEGVCE